MTWNQIGIILLGVVGVLAMWEEWKFFRRQDAEEIAKVKRQKCFKNWENIVQKDKKNTAL